MNQNEEDSIGIRLVGKDGTVIRISRDTIKSAVELLRTLNNVYRQRIIRLLELEDELSVTEIYIKLNLDQSVVSQHLSLLRKFDLLRTKRSGKHILYSLHRERFQYISQLLNKLVNR